MGGWVGGWGSTDLAGFRPFLDAFVDGGGDGVEGLLGEECGGGVPSDVHVAQAQALFSQLFCWGRGGWVGGWVGGWDMERRTDVPAPAALGRK